MEIKCNITDLSHELLCEVLKYLPLRETLAVAMLCKKMSAAVDMHFRLIKTIDFCQDAVCGYMPSSITDDHLLSLLKKCPNLETVYGLHPLKIERRRLRKRSALTIPGIIEALNLCNLKAIETSDLKLFEAIMQHLPHLEIIGHFQNRDGLFPPQASQRLKLQPYPKISSLHLIGVEVPELTAMPHLQHLHLQCVRFTKLQPFRAFLAQNLKSFVMKHCIGPSVPQRYLSLIIALSSSPNLCHLELVRVPLLNGLFQRAVEDSYRHNGFVNLRTLVIAGCKGILEADLGHLMIVASKNLETLYIQPSLTKDSLFVSLSYAQCSFPRLQNLHLGYVDNLNSSGEWSNDALLSFGLAEVPDTPSSITDSGMKVISQLFPCIKTLCVSNCPHLMIMYQWMPAEDLEGWSKLTDLTLQKCHCLQLQSFALFISFLHSIQVVILHDMFREPPKGCSHVGLSAGTGLGMSSAVVSNQDEHIAVQGHQQDFEHPGDEENEENEREFIDVENEDNPEPQFMVLQRDFFDGDDDDVVEGDIPMEEGQDMELEHNGEHDSAENLPVDNSSNKEQVVDKTNSDLHLSKSDKPEDDISTSPASQNVAGSRYNLRKAHKKSSKSIYVQSNSSNLGNEKNVLNDEEIPKDNNKILVKSGSTDSNYAKEYDPHKPSTSKAGKHLDYSVTCDTKQYDTYDSESDGDYKYGSTPKRLKKSSNKQSFSNKVKAPKSKNLTDNNLSKGSSTLKNNDDSSKIENHICSSKSSEKCTTVPHNYSNNINSFPQGEYKVIEPHKNIATKHQEEIFLNKTPDSCSKFSNVKSEPEMHLSSKTDLSTATKDKFNLEDKNSATSDILDNPCTLKENCINNNFSNNNEEELSIIPILKRSESEAEIYENSEEINSHVNDEGKHMPFHIEKSKIRSCSTVVNDTKIECLSENKVIEVNDENSTKTLVISEDKVMPRSETDACDSVVKSEDGNANSCNSSFKLTNENTISKNLNYFPIANNSHISNYAEDAVSPKHDEILSGVYEISDSSPEQMLEKDSVCVTSNNGSLLDGSFNELCKDAEPVINNCNQNTRLKTEVSVNDFINTSLDVAKSTFAPEDVAMDSGVNFDIQVCKNHHTNRDETIKLNSSISESIELPTNIDISHEVKPCSVVLTKIDEILPYAGIDCDKNKTDLQREISCEENFSIKNERSENLRTDDACEPSTSNNRIGIHNKRPRKLSRYAKRTRSHKKQEICAISTNSNCKNSVHTNSILENEIDVDCKSSSSIKSEDENYENKSLKASSKKKKLKNSLYDDKDNFYYVLVPRDSYKSVEIVDSSTGESYKIPSCRVSISQTGRENHNEHLKPKFKNSHKSYSVEKLSDQQPEMSSDYNPNLPSTSKSKINVNHISDKQSLHVTRSASTLSQRCSSRDRNKKMTTRVMKSEKKVKKSNKSSCIEVKEEDNIKQSRNKKNEVWEMDKCVTDYRTVPVEKLQITNSDAVLLIRRCHTEEDNRLNSCTNSACSVKKQKTFINSYIDEEVKNDSVDSENQSLAYQNNYSTFSKGNDISPTSEKGIKSGMHTSRRKQFTKSRKRRKKEKSSFKSSSTKHSTRNMYSRALKGPMISLVSQGTQATSADIRRSVRRIRRATARARRAISSLHISRNSSHPSKISAKMVHKVPKSSYTNPKLPHPETQDKATSTSDPLLEEDAVQTLILASDTLLSFTVVSCGISDLIINRCPKLFHVEVQACRILKKLELNTCPAMKKLNISQCPKLNICALVTAVLSLNTDSYFLASYEPCMQGYHPGDGEKAVLSKATVNQSVLICHDFSDVSCDGMQAKFREKLIIWLRYLSTLHFSLNYAQEKFKRKIQKCGILQCPVYPWSHDIQKMHGHYTYPPQSDFCTSEGQYQLVTNNPIFRDIFETRQIDIGFPVINDCEGYRDNSLLTYNAVEKYLQMKKQFVGFYIPITDNNQINFYK